MCLSMHAFAFNFFEMCGFDKNLKIFQIDF